MRVLAINTSADACEAALLTPEGETVETAPMTTGHDGALAPLVERLMQRAGADFDTLDRIAVVVGPGSFTGVRVGSGFAVGLGLACGVPVVGVTTLEAMEAGPGRILALLPAKRRPPERTWWAQALEDGLGASDPVEASEPELLELAAGAGGVVGAGAPEALSEALSGASSGLGECRPSALAAARLAARTPAERLRGPAPVYVREPDAAPMKPLAGERRETGQA